MPRLKKNGWKLAKNKDIPGNGDSQIKSLKAKNNLMELQIDS